MSRLASTLEGTPRLQIIVASDTTGPAKSSHFVYLKHTHTHTHTHKKKKTSLAQIMRMTMSGCSARVRCTSIGSTSVTLFFPPLLRNETSTPSFLPCYRQCHSGTSPMSQILLKSSAKRIALNDCSLSRLRTASCN